MSIGSKPLLKPAVPYGAKQAEQEAKRRSAEAQALRTQLVVDPMCTKRIDKHTSMHMNADVCTYVCM